MVFFFTSPAFLAILAEADYTWNAVEMDSLPPNFDLQTSLHRQRALRPNRVGADTIAFSSLEPSFLCSHHSLHISQLLTGWLVFALPHALDDGTRNNVAMLAEATGARYVKSSKTRRK
jgi:hypothetical protein